MASAWTAGLVGIKAFRTLATQNTKQGGSMNKGKEAYALGYYFGRAEGSYGFLDLDQFNDIERHEFKLGYDRGVSDYCDYDEEKV